MNFLLLTRNDSKFFSGFKATDKTKMLRTEPNDEINREVPKLKLGNDNAPVENSCCMNPARKPNPPPANMSVNSSSYKIS
jgi:hypothetical protein